MSRKFLFIVLSGLFCLLFILFLIPLVVKGFAFSPGASPSYCLNNKCVNSPQPPPAGYSSCNTVGAHCCDSDEEEYTQSLFYNPANPFAPLSQSSCCPILNYNPVMPNRRVSQVITQANGSKDCCEIPSVVAGPANAQKCCSSNLNPFTKTYIQNPGSENPVTVSEGACCAGPVCTAPDTAPNAGTKTCCPSNKVCDLKTGTCTDTADKCCFCLYTNADGPTCEKIKKSNPIDWLPNFVGGNVASICPDGVSCWYDQDFLVYFFKSRADMEKVSKNPGDLAPLFCKSLNIANRGDVCNWDPKEGCVSRFKADCLAKKARDYNESNPLLGKCDNYPLFEDSSKNNSGTLAALDYLKSKNCSSILASWDKHGAIPSATNPDTCTSQDLRLFLIDIMNLNPGININFLISSCFGGTNLGYTAACIQDKLKQQGSTANVIIGAEQVASSNQMKSTEKVAITANSINYDYIPCSQMGQKGLGASNLCTDDNVGHGDSAEDPNAFTSSFCNDDTTKNPVEKKCCPASSSWNDQNNYNFQWEKPNCDGSCPEVKSDSGIINVCFPVTDDDYANSHNYNKSFSSVYQHEADVMNNCRFRRQHLSIDGKTDLGNGLKIDTGALEITGDIHSPDTEYCMTIKYTCYYMIKSQANQ